MNKFLGKKITTNIISALLMLTPWMAAEACAVCMGGIKQETLDAYFIMVMTLTFIPLAVATGFFFYIRYKIRQRERDSQKL